MKTTIYELLGMIKDGKASDITTNFIFDGEKCNLLAFLDRYALDINSLNWEIEIIEDTLKEESEIPEKLKLYAPYPECDDKRFDVVEAKINEIIDYLKSKGE